MFGWQKENKEKFHTLKNRKQTNKNPKEESQIHSRFLYENNCILYTF